MKINVRKWNRGLLLGAILLIGLIVMILVKDAQFKKEIPDIRERAKEYLAASIDYATLSSDTSAIGRVLTDGEKEERTKALNALLDEYWYQGKENYHNYYITADYIREMQNSIMEEKVFTVIRSADYLLTERSISVKSDGPDRAIVEIGLDDVSVLLYGIPDTSALFLETAGNEGWYYDEGEGSVTAYRCRASGSIELSMRRDNGKWMIVDSNGYFYSTNWYEETEGGNAE